MTRTATRPWTSRAVLLAVALVAAAACGGTDQPSAAGDRTGSPPPTAVDVADEPTGETAGEAAADGSEPCPVDALDDAPGPVAITMWHWMQVELGDTLAALVERYHAEQDRVRVQLVFQGGADEALDKYLTALRGGTRPTVVQLSEVALQLGIDSGSFVPVQACIDAAGYDTGALLERAVAAHSVDGVLHPMPFNTSVPILYANRAMLERAGVSDLPSTLEELREAAQAVVDAGLAPAGLALKTSPGLIEQWFALGDQPFVDGGNGRAERATELLIDTPFGHELFAWLAATEADGLAVNVGAGDGAEHFIAVATGQAAMTIDTSAALRSVMVASRQFPDIEVAVGPMPSLGERTGGVLVGGGGLWLDGSTDDRQRAAAWDFLRWLAEPEQQAQWHAGTGYLPIHRQAVEAPSVVELWEAEPEFRVAYDQLLDGPETEATAGPVLGNHPQVRSRAVQPALDRMWIQGQPADAALAQAKADGDALVAEYRRRVGG